MQPRILYILFTFAGMSALIYQVIWTRDFRLVFGSSTRSAGAVLAAFFLGMALGNLLGGRLARRADVIRLYGWTELFIGFAALLIGPLLAIYESWYPFVYELTGGNVAALGAARLLLAFLALAPPTIAMGVTLPLMTRAVATDPNRIARQTGILYSLNIFGAVLGVFLAGFVLPMRLGVAGSVYFAVGINLLVGVAALAVSRQFQSPIFRNNAPTESPPARRPSWSLLIVAAVSGFGTLALEVAYMRILSQRTEASVYSFAIMLITFLLFLAVGSAWVAWRLDRTDPWRFLAHTQLVAVPMILVSPLLFQAVQFVGLFGGDETLTIRLVKLTLASWLLLGPTIALVGVVLPTTWKIATRDVAMIGQHVGLLTSVNTLAAVAGSLIAGFVLLPWLGVVGSVLVVAPLYGLVAIIACFQGYQGLPRWIGCATCVAILIAWFAFGPWDRNFQSVPQGGKLLSYHDGEAASVAVIETRGGQRVMKMNHEYLLGSSGGSERELGQGRLPLMLHPKPKRVAFLGVATGITAASAMEFPVERVVAMELIPGVADEVDKFEKWNKAFYRDPRVTLIVDDARNHLLGSQEQYDVIIGDLFVPWHAGTGDMYTVEQFKNCRDRLAPGGMFAQWLAGYQLTIEELRSIVASFAEVFPVVTLWRNDFDINMPIVCLIGYRDPADVVLDFEKLRQDSARIAATENGPSIVLANPAGVEMLFVAGDEALRLWAKGAPLNTDNWPFIEYATPVSFFRHRQRDSEPLMEVFSSDTFRPPVWPYAGSSSSNHSPEKSFSAADLILKASLAESQNNYVKEAGLLKEVIASAGDLPPVQQFIIESAYRFRQRKMADRSTELLEAVIQRAPDSVPALMALAQSLLAEKRDEEAIVHLERICELDPQRTDVRLRLVALLTSRGEYEQAEPHLQWLVEAKPEDAGLRIDRARAFHEQGKSAEAAGEIEVFRKLDLGDKRTQLWTRMRTYGLGEYVDQPGTVTQ